MSLLKKLFNRRGSSSKHSDDNKNDSDKSVQINSTANQIANTNIDAVKKIDRTTDEANAKDKTTDEVKEKIVLLKSKYTIHVEIFSRIDHLTLTGTI